MYPNSNVSETTSVNRDLDPRTNSPMQTPDEVQLAAVAIVEHLRRESEYLDTVIECSLEMKGLLLRNATTRPQKVTVATINDESDSLPAAPDDSTTAFDQLTKLRGDLARQFVPVLEGRQQMQTAFKYFETLLEAPPTLTKLAPQLEPGLRGELRDLRTNIKAKLQEVQAITMGNQAVLIYTLDFYHRLITGLTGEAVPAKAYNSQGQMTQTTSHSILEKRA